MKVVEIYRTLHGDGMALGRPAVFVRFGGCDFSCKVCDTPRASRIENASQWRDMTAGEVSKEVLAMSKPRDLVVFTGGNPAIQNEEEMEDLIVRLDTHPLCETQGSIACSWFSRLGFLHISPKSPSFDSSLDAEGWTFRIDDCLFKFRYYSRDAESAALKIIIGTDADWEYAKKLADTFCAMTVFVEPLNDVAEVSNRDSACAAMRVLSKKILEEGAPNMRLMPQLHYLLWGNEPAT